MVEICLKKFHGIIVKHVIKSRFLYHIDGWMDHDNYSIQLNIFYSNIERLYCAGNTYRDVGLNWIIIQRYALS